MGQRARGKGEVGDGCGLGGEEHKRGCEQAGQGDFGWRAALGAPRFVADSGDRGCSDGQRRRRQEEGRGKLLSFCKLEHCQTIIEALDDAIG